MDRMHAYKDKVAKKKEKEVSVGLFTYPILMAADILLYDATHVPVGRDQKQHVEYARDIAQKFNHRFRDSGSDDDDTGDIFTLPESYIQEDVAIIPGTDWRKMSKSYNNYIWLLDTPSEILKKIKRIPTAAIAIDAPKNPDECNVYKIFKLFLDDAQDAALRERYTAGGLSFKEVKEELAETVVAFVTPIQEQYAKIDDDMIRDLLTTNAVKANEIASKKVAEVYEKVGFSL